MTKSITKKERRAALKRTKDFTKEFSEKPEHTINLDDWYHPVYESTVLPEGVPHCGSVGCVGGYATHSPLMKAYCKKYDLELSYDKNLYSFFGVTSVEASKKNLFASRLKSNIPDKVEGMQRLNKLIKFHETQLARA